MAVRIAREENFQAWSSLARFGRWEGAVAKVRASLH